MIGRRIRDTWTPDQRQRYQDGKVFGERLREGPLRVGDADLQPPFYALGIADGYAPAPDPADVAAYINDLESALVDSATPVLTNSRVLAEVHAWASRVVHGPIEPKPRPGDDGGVAVDAVSAVLKKEGP